MALTPQEQLELEQLQKEMSTSVMSPLYQGPSLGQQIKEVAIENLPALGGMIGGVGGALFTRNPALTQEASILGSAAVRSMLGAGLGGATGEAARQAVTGMSPSLRSLLGAGVEQAFYDAAGNLIFTAGGKAFSLAKNEISKRFGSEVPENATIAAQKLLQEEGATLTPYQATGDAWAGFKESLGRGSFTGKPVFEKAAKKTEEAVMSAKGKILDDVSTRVYDSVQTGQEFAKAISEGDSALKEAVKPFYDTLSQQGRKVSVDIVPIKSEASRVLGAADKAKGLTLSANEKGYLEQINKLPENIDFATAHEIISSFKTKIRDLRNAAEPDTATVARLTKIVSSLEGQMDAAGSKLAGSALSFDNKIAGDTATKLSDQYKFYSQLYRDSIRDLYSDTTSKLLAKDPEFVGKTIFQNGNVTAFDEAVAGLGRAKQLNPELNIKQTVESVRRGYLENLLKTEGSFSKLGEKLDNDEALRRTFEKVLTKDQQKNVRTLLEAAKLSEVTPSATAPLFFAAQQAQATGAVLGVGALLLSDDAKKAAADNPFWSTIAGGTILLGPRFWAKAATNPQATNAALGLIKAQESGNIGKNLLLKTGLLFTNAGIKPEDLTGTTEVKQPAVGLTPDEEAELKSLKQELGR